MAQIPVSEREFDRAWRKHMQAVQGLPNNSNVSHSRNLLLFYAAECLVKARLLRYYRVDSYEKLPPHAQIGHRINAGLDELRVGVPKVPEVVAKDRAGTSIQHYQLHQAWRYGKTLDQAQQQQAVEVLRQIISKLGNE